MILSSDASRRISCLNRRAVNSDERWRINGLWLRIVGTTLFTCGIIMIILPFSLILIYYRIVGFFVGYIDNEIFAIAPLIILYIFGVYGTYRYDVWLKKNFPKGMTIEDIK